MAHDETQTALIFAKSAQAEQARVIKALQKDIKEALKMRDSWRDEASRLKKTPTPAGPTAQALANAENAKLKKENRELSDSLEQAARNHNTEVAKVFALTTQNNNLRSAVATYQANEQDRAASKEAINRASWEHKAELKEARADLAKYMAKVNRLVSVVNMAKSMLNFYNNQDEVG